MSTAVATKPQNKSAESMMEFVPFMGKEPVKLSVSIVQNMVCVPTKQGHVCNAVQAMKFMMLCRARALNPFEGDAYMIGYDTKDGPQFSLITAHQAFLKRAEVHPEYDGMESGVIVSRNGEIMDLEGDFLLDDDVLLGAWAVVHFKNRKHPMRKRCKLATFRKPYGRWNDDAAGMIVKCCEADALRSAFPTQLGGMYLDDEMPQTFDVESTAAPANGNGHRSKSDEMAERLAQASPPPQPEINQDKPIGVGNLQTDLDRCQSLADVQAVQELYGEDMEADALETICDARREAIRNTPRGAASNTKQKQAFDTHPNSD